MKIPQVKGCVSLCVVLIIMVFMVTFVRTEAEVTEEEIRNQNKGKRGDLRPPIHRNRIIRVSRGPTIPSSEEEFQSQQQSIKSPPYQLRFHRPGLGRLAQLHSYSILSGRTPMANGLNILNIPGIGRSSKGHSQGPGQRYNHPTQQSIDDLFPLEDQFESNSDDEQPTFTPYIGARALSNMEKFFHHLRENINALQQEEDESNSQGLLASDADMKEFSIGDDPGQFLTSSSQVDWHDDDSSSSETQVETGANQNQNYGPGSGGREAVLGVRWKPPASASGILHGSGAGAGSNYASFGNNPSSRLNTRNHRYVPSVTTSPINPSTQESDFKRANNFNPSWMWTNLGLGKK